MKIPKLRNEENLPSYDEATHFGFPRRLPPLSSITNNPTLQVDDIEFEDYGSLQKHPNQYPQMQKPLPSTGTTPLVHMRHPQPRPVTSRTTITSTFHMRRAQDDQTEGLTAVGSSVREGNITEDGVTIFHTIPVNFAINEKLLGPKPANTQCPECGHFIVTKTEPAFGMFACFSSSLLCMLGCWCFALLPCYVGSFLDVAHYCTQCNDFVGIFRRLG